MMMSGVLGVVGRVTCAHACAAIAVLLVACGPGFVRPPKSVHVQPPPETGTLRLDLSPHVAHAYVRDEATHEIVAVCTWACSMKLPPGRFRLAAGLSHRRLSEHKSDIVIEPNRATNLRVEVRERVSRRTGGTIAFGGLWMFAAAVAVGTVNEIFESRAVDRVAGAMLVGGLGISLGTIVTFAGFLDYPTVKVRSWEPR